MSSPNLCTPGGILPNCARRCAGQGRRGWEHPSAWGEASSAPLGGLRSRPMGPPYMSIKCSDSHDMKENGFRFCFLASGQHGEILPGLYCLRRQPARWRALGTPSRHYASKE